MTNFWQKFGLGENQVMQKNFSLQISSYKTQKKCLPNLLKIFQTGVNCKHIQKKYPCPQRMRELIALSIAKIMRKMKKRKKNATE